MRLVSEPFWQRYSSSCCTFAITAVLITGDVGDSNLAIFSNLSLMSIFPGTHGYISATMYTNQVCNGPLHVRVYTRPKK